MLCDFRCRLVPTLLLCIGGPDFLRPCTIYLTVPEILVNLLESHSRLSLDLHLEAAGRE